MNHKQKVMIVGNGPVSHDHSTNVDSASKVYRFNDLKSIQRNTGKKTDSWVIATHPVLLKKLQESIPLIEHRLGSSWETFIGNLKEVVFSVPTYFQAEEERKFLLYPERISAIENFIKTLALENKRKIVARYARSALDPLKHYPLKEAHKFPSNGYFTLFTLLESSPASEFELHLIGFSWEGWAGHPWEAEKQFATGLALGGKIHIDD